MTGLGLRVFIDQAAANAVEVTIPYPNKCLVAHIADKGRSPTVVAAAAVSRITHLRVIRARLRIGMFIATAAGTHLAKDVYVG